MKKGGLVIVESPTKARTLDRFLVLGIGLFCLAFPGLCRAEGPVAAEAGVKSGELQKRIDDLVNSFHLQKEEGEKPILWLLGNQADPQPFFFHRFVLYGDGTVLFGNMTKKAQLTEEETKELLRGVLQKVELIPQDEVLPSFASKYDAVDVGPAAILGIKLKEFSKIYTNFGFGHGAERTRSQVWNLLMSFTHEPFEPYLSDRMILSFEVPRDSLPLPGEVAELSQKEEPGIAELVHSVNEVQIELAEQRRANEERIKQAEEKGVNWPGSQFPIKFRLRNPRQIFTGKAVNRILPLVQKGKGWVKVGDQHYIVRYALIPPGFEDSGELRVGKSR